MKKSRFTESKTVGVLKQVDTGANVEDAQIVIIVNHFSHERAFIQTRLMR